MKKQLLIVLLITSAAFIYAYSDNPYFTIGKKDVAVKYPAYFPKPVYNFENNRPTPAGFVLGRMLFYDPILSRDSSTSCASCHQRFAAFAHIDHALSHGINGLIGKRNVPAIQNMIWQSSFMWDGAVNHLEQQPLAPITNPVEMDNELITLMNKLQHSKIYPAMFYAAFSDSQITSQHFLQAIAQFVGLMISCNSKYDAVMQHKDSFTTDESAGYQLFKQHCTSCHTEPLFTDNSFRNNGLKPDTTLHDLGRYNITHDATDSMKFKVPSLRNVELTYPYMHDGRFHKLEDVLAFYSVQSLHSGKADPLISNTINLTATEQQQIITFLKTLTDKTFVYDRRFDDPNKQMQN